MDHSVNMFEIVAGVDLFRTQRTRFSTVKYVSVFQRKQQQNTCFAYANIYSNLFLICIASRTPHVYVNPLTSSLNLL